MKRKIMVSLGTILVAIQLDAAEPCSVAIAYQDRIVDANIVAAIEKGFLEKNGVQTKAHLFRSGPECTEALLHGGVQIATMGDAAAEILLSSQGNSYQILLGHGGGERRHRIVISQELSFPEGLIGKRVAVKFGTSTHAGLMKYMEKHQYKWELVDLSPNLQMTALAAKEVGAIVASEPTPSEAEKSKKGKVVADLGGLQNEYPVVLVVNRKWNSENIQCAAKIEKSIRLASDWVKANPQEMAEILARKSGITPATALKSMELHSFRVHSFSEIQHSLKQTGQFLRDKGYID